MVRLHLVERYYQDLTHSFDLCTSADKHTEMHSLGNLIKLNLPYLVDTCIWLAHCQCHQMLEKKFRARLWLAPIVSCSHARWQCLPQALAR